MGPPLDTWDLRGPSPAANSAVGFHGVGGRIDDRRAATPGAPFGYRSAVAGDPGFERTQIWRGALAPRANDPDARARERLRAAFLRMREQAAVIAGEIGLHLPELTVHDVTHLDALWEMADLVLGDERALTPCETFVLGGAILCHDLANGAAAYPGGMAQLRDSEVWRDAVASAQRRGGQSAAPGAAVSPEIGREADGWALRRMHAEQAAKLPTMEWVDRRGRTTRLLADDELRDELGPLIGQLAQSHWFSIGQLRGPFEAEIAGPTWCPREWTIDPLTVACLLRLADAAHIDIRRAPPLLYALRRPAGVSDAHWSFQRRMRRPVRRGDALEYRSATKFPAEERDAWWTAVEAVTMIDRELRQVDALLAEAHRARFACRRLTAIDIEALRDRFPCDGWRPVDTRVRIGDVAAMVERLGGQQLYGNRPWVPLRELIQNAADAIRARRLAESRAADWGRIDVRIGQDGSQRWVEVEDCGIGMSEAVVTGPLLDFGASYWSSSLLREEYPGLLARGFRASGRHGIGFFSVFIWGLRVTVTTRSCKEAPTATRVLEFNRGLRVPPLVRPARSDEVLADGGTRVRVWLDRPVEDGQSLFGSDRTNLAALLQWLCPALDVDVWATTAAAASAPAVRANDWLEIPAADLLARCSYSGEPPRGSAAALRQTVLDADSGQPVGRAAVAFTGTGILVCDGLRVDQDFATRSGPPYVGILFGEPIGVARNEGAVAVSQATIHQWLGAQVDAIATGFTDVKRFRFAQKIEPLLRRPLTELPVLWSSRGWTLADFARIPALPRVLILAEEDLVRPFNQPFDFPTGMPAHVFVPCAKWSLDLADPEACPTFVHLLAETAESWGVPIEKILLRSNLRLQRRGTPIPRGGDDPSLIDDQIQVVLHPDVTGQEMKAAFAAFDGWRPINGSHAAAMNGMQRLGAAVWEAKRRELSQRTDDEK